MSDAGQTRAYRERVYEKYVSEKVRADGVSYSEKDYQRWADAAQVRLRGWLPSDRNTPVLDMGCGPGRFLWLLSQLGYTDLTGVDLSSEQVALARKWCPRATVIQGDLREVLVQNPNRFGLIAGFDVIEHFGKDEILPLLTLVAQSLRPGGRVILQTPNAESPWGLRHRYHDLTHELAFDPHSLAHVLGMVGLSGFTARECGPYAHGFKSLVRVIIWRMIHTGLVIWNLAETGGEGSGVYTRVFVASAVKSED